MGTPFKMKGSPFQRNFGIGSPLKDDKTKTSEIKTHDASGKRIMSLSDEQTQKDLQLLSKANDPTNNNNDSILFILKKLNN